MTDNSIWSATGAPIPAHLAREQLWLASGGQTGIVGPDSCEVVAQGTPNNTVRILPGGFAIAATSARAAIGYTSAPWQSYGRSLYDSLTVEIAPTSSAGGRTDVVGIVIHDPDFEGLELEGEELANHQFWSTHVVQNAGNNATRPEHFASLRRPFLPLAQIRIPRSTGTITNAMIHDIRFTASSWSWTKDLMQITNDSSSNIIIPASQTSWMTVDEFSGVPVPQWAGVCKVTMMLGPVHTVRGAANGEFRLRTSGQSGTAFNTIPAVFVEPDHGEQTGGSTRFYMHTAGEIPLSAATAGGTSTFELQVRRTSPAQRPGDLVIPGSNINICRSVGKATYEEAPRRA